MELGHIPSSALSVPQFLFGDSTTVTGADHVEVPWLVDSVSGQTFTRTEVSIPLNYTDIFSDGLAIASLYLAADLWRKHFKQNLV
jgi:hypothetical protein